MRVNINMDWYILADNEYNLNKNFVDYAVLVCVSALLFRSDLFSLKTISAVSTQQQTALSVSYTHLTLPTKRIV